MTEKQFCYCCRVHHDKRLMQPFRTRQGERWRCVRSIEAAARNQQARDAFGRQQTEFNLEASRLAAERLGKFSFRQAD